MRKILQNKVKIALFIAIFLFFGNFFTVKVSAVSSADTINFRTSIINNKQQALSDGAYNFRFIIFSQQTGGIALWSESITGVTTRLGGLSVNLGEVAPIPASIFLDNSNLFLQVCLDANGIGADGTALCGGGFEEEFRPRRKITAVPLAFRARNLGPATINNGETAYSIKTFGAEGNILGLDFNGLNRLGLTTAGTLTLLNGANTFGLSPLNQRLDLTQDTDIFFGSERSIQSNTTGFEFLTNSISRMIIDNNGNVGIGTNTPTSRLIVAGGTAILAKATTDYSTLRLSDSVGINPATPITGDLWWNGTQLYFYNGTSNINLLAGGGAPAGLDGEVQFNNAGAFGASSSFFWDNGNSRLGLGTSSPSSMLHVNGGNALIGTSAGTGGRLGIWDGVPGTTTYLRIDNSVNSQTGVANLYPIHISALNDSTGGQTRGILTELNTGASNAPGTMSNYRGVINLNSSASYGNDAPNELFFTGMSSRINGNDGELINKTYVSSYDANITNAINSGFATNIAGTGTLSFYRGVGENNASVNAIYSQYLQMDNLLAGSVNSFYGNYISLNNAGTINNDYIGNNALIVSTGGIAGNIGGIQNVISTSGTITGNQFGVSSSIIGSATVDGDIIGYDFFTNFTGSADNLYGIRLDWSNPGSSVDSHYGIYVNTVTSGSSANYGLYLEGASGGTTNASIWVDSGLTRLAAATATESGLRITSGVDPTSPVSGDLWWNGTQLYFYNGTSNIDLLISGVTSVGSGNGLTGGPITSTGSLSINAPTCVLGEALSWNGTAFACVTTGGGSGTPDGNDGEVQFNNSGSFGASSDFFWDNGNSRLGLGNSSPSQMLHLTSGNILGEGSRMALFDAAISGESILNIGSLANAPLTGNFYPIYNDNTLDGAANMGYVEGFSNRISNWGLVDSYAGIANYMINTSAADVMYGIYNQVTNNWTAGNSYGLYNALGVGTVSGNFVGNYIDIGAGTVGGYSIGSYIRSQAAITSADFFAGVYIDPITGGTNANYGIYVGGASGGTTNASIWVNSGLTRLAASTASTSGLRIDEGVDPSSPVTGDLWWNGNELYFFDGSSNVDLLAAGGSGTPDGSDGEVQFNNSGSFGASSDFFWDNGNSRLGLGNSSPSQMLHLTSGNILGEGSRMALFDATIAGDSVLEINSTTNAPLAGNFFPVRNTTGIPVAASLGFVETISNTLTNDGSTGVMAGYTNYVTNNNSAGTIYGLYNQVSNAGSGTGAFGIYTTTAPGTLSGNFVGNQITMGAGAAGGFVIGNYVSFAGGLTAGDMMAGVYIDPFSGGTNNNYGVYVGGLTGAATNSYGMYIGSVTGSTSSYGLFIAGAETTDLYITRTATNGIYFGTGAGEGANDIVTQDGILHVTGAIAMTGACSDSDGGDGGVDGCDIAETFWSNDTLEKGEVVMLTASDNTNWKLISRTVSKSDKAIGIISTNPTIVMGNTPFKDSKSYPVGLSGVLPTKVTDQNGLIKRGDFVTVSDTPGHGMKAGSGDLTLGIAMEDQTTSIATINVLVSRNNLPNETQNLDPIEAKINLLQEEIANLSTQLAGIVINPDEFTATEKAQILTLKDLIAVSESTLVISGTLDVNILKANISELGRLTLGGDRSGILTGTIDSDTIEVGVTEFTAINKVFVTFNGKAPIYWVEKLEGKFVIHFEEPLTSDIIGDYIVIE